MGKSAEGNSQLDRDTSPGRITLVPHRNLYRERGGLRWSV